MWVVRSKGIYSYDGEIRSNHVFLKTVYGAIMKCHLGPDPTLSLLSAPFYSVMRVGLGSPPPPLPQQHVPLVPLSTRASRIRQ